MNLNSILYFVIQIAVLLFAVSIHESAHGWMAEKFGDSTARVQGRISLNPIRHIDPIGSVVFPIILAIMGAPVFGWAKPVQVNPYNLRNPRKANVYIAAAGPGSNIIAAGAAIALFLLLRSFGVVMVDLLRTGITFGGSAPILTIILFYFIIINVYLTIFNLIPIPPLDGSGIVEGFLHGEALRTYMKIRPYGMIILFGLLYLGVFRMIATPILTFLFMIIRG